MFDFGPTTWVVWGWVNSQFATVLDVCFFPSFLSFLFSSARLHSHRGMNGHQSMLSRRVLRQGCARWVLEYFIFTFLSICH